MGSTISLWVGDFEVDWGKNNIFMEHNPLFQPGDVHPKKDSVKLLKYVLPRVELLGHTLDSARREYEELLKINGNRLNITFDELEAALKICKLKRISRFNHNDNDYVFGKFFANEIYPRLGLRNLGERPLASKDNLGEVMENFHPWSIIRLVAENPANLDRPVTWDFAEIVNNGWATASDFSPGLGNSQRFLIVTEGSSDAKILQKALELLRPEVRTGFKIRYCLK